MTVPAHAVETVFERHTWFAPAGLRRSKSLSQTVSVQIGKVVEDWCDEHNIVAQGYYNHTSQRHHIVIYGSSQAMLFKLRWL